jgi:hypothetical protein
MAKETRSQAYQAANNEIEQLEADQAAARELAERKAGQANGKQNKDKSDADAKDPADEAIVDKHARAGLDEASQENAQHPFNTEVATQVDPQPEPQGDEEDVVTTDEYGETIGQPYGESDEHGDTTTPRKPESGHTEEQRGRSKRRGDRKQGEAEEERGGVTGT